MNYLNVMYDKKIKPVTDYPAQLCTYLCERFNLKGNLLDAGCGRGDFAHAFRWVNLRVEGLDGEVISENNLVVCKTDFDTDSFPYPDNHFDTVFSKSVIEHLENPEHYLKECLRVLKPGGRLILLTPDWFSQKDIFYDDPTHRHPYTVEGISNIMKMVGFANIEAEKFYQVPIVWRHPIMKVLCCILQHFIPVRWGLKNNFLRFSIELMVLGTGVKHG